MKARHPKVLKVKPPRDFCSLPEAFSFISYHSNAKTKSAMPLDSHNPAHYLGRIGIAHFCMGEWKETVEAVEKALKLNPELGPPAAVLGSAYAHLGRDEEAEGAYQNYLQRRPNYQGIYWPYADMYWWPFKDREVDDCFVEGPIMASFPSLKLTSLHVSKEDQLTGDDLRAVAFAPAKIGSYPGFWSSETTKDGIVTLHSD